MFKLETKEQLNKEIVEALKSKPVSNAPLPFGFYSALEAGRLFAEKMDGALFLLDDQGFRYRIYFYLDREKLLSKRIKGSLTLSKYAALEFLFKEGDPKDEVQSFFEAMGFVLKDTRLRMSAPKKLFSWDADTSVVHQAYKEDAEEDYKMFSSYCDSFTGCLPTMEDFKKKIEEGLIYSIGEKGKPVAALHVEKHKAYLEYRHMAVSKEARGKHYSQALFGRAAELSDSPQVKLWVGIHNERAIDIYLSMGMKKENIQSLILVKEK